MAEIRLNEDDFNRIKEKLAKEAKQLPKDEVELLEALVKKVETDTKDKAHAADWFFAVWEYNF